MDSRWNVWTNAGRDKEAQSFYEIAAGLTTDDAITLVAILERAGWSANRTKVQ